MHTYLTFDSLAQDDAPLTLRSGEQDDCPLSDDEILEAQREAYALDRARERASVNDAADSYAAFTVWNEARIAKAALIAGVTL